MSLKQALAISLTVLAAGVVCSAQARSVAAAARPVHAAAAPTRPTSTPHSSAAHTASSHLGVVVAGPASTVSHPGGIPGVNSPVQAAPGFQPLLPTGGFVSFGAARPRSSKVAIVAYPQVFGYLAAPFVDPTGGVDSGVPVSDPNAPQPDQPNESQTFTPDPVPPQRTSPFDSEPSAAPAKPTPPDPPYTLLAFKDHSFFTVTDYWVSNDRLMYVTNYGETNSAPLDALDLTLTVKLNGEHGVTFELHSK